MRALRRQPKSLGGLERQVDQIVRGQGGTESRRQRPQAAVRADASGTRLAAIVDPMQLAEGVDPPDGDGLSPQRLQEALGEPFRPGVEGRRHQGLRGVGEGRADAGPLGEKAVEQAGRGGVAQSGGDQQKAEPEEARQERASFGGQGAEHRVRPERGQDGPCEEHRADTQGRDDPLRFQELDLLQRERGREGHRE